MKLAADIVDRSLPYEGTDRVAQAIARDPALRALPSDVLAHRLGVTRGHVEHAIANMVRQYAGAFVQVAGRSFDEAIADAGAARRPALSPEPLNEAAGFRGGAGILTRRAMLHGAPPGQSLAWRRRVAGAMGYQSPPVPDLAAILLSDAFPPTRRFWSNGLQPTADERIVLNWQHPLVTNATSPQSIATLKALSGGCLGWDGDARVAGQTLHGRSQSDQAHWWNGLQTLCAKAFNPVAASGSDYLYGSGEKGGTGFHDDYIGGSPWGLPPPTITKDQTTLAYWDCSDDKWPRAKVVYWMNHALQQLSPGEAVIDATWAKQGAHMQCDLDGDSGNVTWSSPEGWDFERESMKLFAGLQGTISGLTTAIATAVSVYCAACGVAIKIAGNLAANAAAGAVNVKALSSFGDQMLMNATKNAFAGDPSALNSLRAFAGALIGLSPQAAPGAQPAGGLVYDYLSTLGTASGNVPAALQAFAQDHTNKISNAATLSQVSGVPLVDAQYAVAAMTDTLSRFASNVSNVYMPPDWTPAQKMQYRMQQSFLWQHAHPVPLSLNQLPMIPPRTATPPASSSSGGAIVVGAAAVGVAWYLGLLKGLI